MPVHTHGAQRARWKWGSLVSPQFLSSVRINTAPLWYLEFGGGS